MRLSTRIMRIAAVVLLAGVFLGSTYGTLLADVAGGWSIDAVLRVMSVLQVQWTLLLVWCILGAGRRRVRWMTTLLGAIVVVAAFSEVNLFHLGRQPVESTLNATFESLFVFSPPVLTILAAYRWATGRRLRLRLSDSQDATAVAGRHVTLRELMLLTAACAAALFAVRLWLDDHAADQVPAIRFTTSESRINLLLNLTPGILAAPVALQTLRPSRWMTAVGVLILLVGGGEPLLVQYLIPEMQAAGSGSWLIGLADSLLWHAEFVGLTVATFILLRLAGATLERPTPSPARPEAEPTDEA